MSGAQEARAERMVSENKDSIYHLKREVAELEKTIANAKSEIAKKQAEIQSLEDETLRIMMSNSY